ncbi:T-complex protein 11 [Homalodisca vitripennis]|nr:T-complex protein 11 [Homalodisca vitripennis]
MKLNDTRTKFHSPVQIIFQKIMDECKQNCESETRSTQLINRYKKCWFHSPPQPPAGGGPLLRVQRIKEFLHLMITSTVPSQLQVPAGLSTFTKELSGLAARYHRLVSHNRSVFGEYYTDILSTFQVPNGV